MKGGARTVKRIGVILTLCVILIAVLASPLQILAAQGNTVLLMHSKEAAGKELEIDVVVEENSGVSGMLLSLEYDTSALTLIGMEYGPALSSLSPLHTNTDTPDGYAVYPFKLTYLGEENDTSTGRMMTLRFRVTEDAADGVYTIALQHERDRDVTYLADGEIRTKNLLIGDAKVTISEHEIVKIEDALHTGAEESDAGGARVIWPWILVGGALAVGGGILLTILLIKRSKRKKWTKI